MNTSFRSAFSLIEVLASLGIVAMLAIVLIPAINNTRENANNVGCLANLRQISAAATAYAAENDAWAAPPSFWRKFNDGGYLATNSRVWICPSDKRANKVLWGQGPISYGINAEQIGWVPAYYDQSQKKLAQITAPTKTIYFSDAEAYVMRIYNPMWIFRHRKGSINAVFFDGHAESLSFTNQEDFLKLIAP